MKTNGSGSKKLSRNLVFFSVLLVALLISVWARVEQVTLAWDANTVPDPAGDRAHYGSASGGYTTSVDVHLAGRQLAEPAVGIDDAAAFDPFSAPSSRIANANAPPTRSYCMSKFSDFVDTVLQRFEIIDTLFGEQGV
jgi:hypothetical protein